MKPAVALCGCLFMCILDLYRMPGAPVPSWVHLCTIFVSLMRLPWMYWPAFWPLSAFSCFFCQKKIRCRDINVARWEEMLQEGENNDILRGGILFSASSIVSLHSNILLSLWPIKWEMTCLVGYEHLRLDVSVGQCGFVCVCVGVSVCSLNHTSSLVSVYTRAYSVTDVKNLEL